MVAALLCVTGGAAYLGSAVVARHRVQAVADLGALAAAERLPAGAESACTRATAVARAMGIARIGCAVQGLDVVVSVEMDVTFGGVVRAAARAGPAPLSGSPPRLRAGATLKGQR
ncbi:Rv3654c family TadE-like protein [Mycobacterium botniense]|nr:Rv3654c family TadE-like protein [Mycobacterium botniense]